MSGLRDYQVATLDQVRELIRKGTRQIMVVLPTGSGKTVIFCVIVKGGSQNGLRCGIMVRGRKLVDQASQRLFRENVEHGVIMAKHWNFRPSQPIQVCSVDTMIARGVRPLFDILIIDEFHLFAPESKASDIIAQYKAEGTKIISFSASPWTGKSLRHLGDAIINPIKMQELIDKEHLRGFRYFAPNEPNLKGLKIQNGDFQNTALEERMTRGQLTGDIIKHWKNIASGRPTICFAVNIHHSELLAEKFNAAGIPAEHCDANTPDGERNAIIRRLESGATKVVCNVGILCTGVDIPCLGAIIMARPTKSYNLYIQQIGRGTRLFEGKTDCILLDHAGNIKRHGFPTMEPEIDIDGKITSERPPLESKLCKSCFEYYRGKDCPNCGPKEEAGPRKGIVENDEELEEIAVTAKHPIEQWLEYLEQQRKKTNRKNGWQYYKLIEKFPYEECKPYLPQWFKSKKDSEYKDNPFASSPFSGHGGNE